LLPRLRRCNPARRQYGRRCGGPQILAHGLVPRLETSLFYGRHLRVVFVEFIRPEKKFAGLDELKAQIAENAARARTILAAVPPLE
jgi:riboflavin kinase / FMN adenylyltransferase